MFPVSNKGLLTFGYMDDKKGCFIEKNNSIIVNSNQTQTELQNFSCGCMNCYFRPKLNIGVIYDQDGNIIKPGDCLSGIYSQRKTWKPNVTGENIHCRINQTVGVIYNGEISQNSFNNDHLLQGILTNPCGCGCGDSNCKHCGSGDCSKMNTFGVIYNQNENDIGYSNIEMRQLAGNNPPHIIKHNKKRHMLSSKEKTQKKQKTSETSGSQTK